MCVTQTHATQILTYDKDKEARAVIQFGRLFGVIHESLSYDPIISFFNTQSGQPM